MSADVLADDGLPRYVWEPVPTNEAEYATTVLLSIKQAQRWRAEYETGEAAAGRPDPRRPRQRRRRACGQPFGNHSPAASR